MLADELHQFVHLYTGDQIALIHALADKIQHMCVNIGSPLSAKEMIESIVKGKRKKWHIDRTRKSSYLNFEKRGQKANPYLHENENNQKGYEFITGHFRWNHGKTYKANRETRDYIKTFYIDKNITELKRKHKKSKNNFRFTIGTFSAIKHDETTYSIEINSNNGMGYRYHYFPNGNRVSTNYRAFEMPITKEEERWVRAIIFEKYPSVLKIIEKELQSQ
jgi:hypothetical protein